MLATVDRACRTSGTHGQMGIMACSERRMTNEISLRDVRESDLPIFFDHQLDPEATRMAAFPSRDRDAFMAHWAKSMAARSATFRTILFEERVAGYVVCWDDSGERKVGFWIGREHWGKGIASAALAQFLRQVTVRPLGARVAKHNVASLQVLQKCGFAISGEDRTSGADGDRCEEYILTLGAGEG